MNSQQAFEFLTSRGESPDWAIAVVSDARFDGQANLLKWDITYNAESEFTVTPRPPLVRSE